MTIVVLHCVTCSHPISATSKSAAAQAMADHLVFAHLMVRGDTL